VIGDILKLADESYQNMRKNIFRAAMRFMELEEQAGEGAVGRRSVEAREREGE